MLTILTGQPSKYKEILKDPNLVLDNANRFLFGDKFEEKNSKGYQCKVKIEVTFIGLLLLLSIFFITYALS